MPDEPLDPDVPDSPEEPLDPDVPAELKNKSQYVVQSTPTPGSFVGSAQ